MMKETVDKEKQQFKYKRLEYSNIYIYCAGLYFLIYVLLGLVNMAAPVSDLLLFILGITGMFLITSHNSDRTLKYNLLALDYNFLKMRYKRMERLNNLHGSILGEVLEIKNQKTTKKKND